MDICFVFLRRLFIIYFIEHKINKLNMVGENQDKQFCVF